MSDYDYTGDFDRLIARLSTRIDQYRFGNDQQLEWLREAIGEEYSRQEKAKRKSHNRKIDSAIIFALIILLVFYGICGMYFGSIVRQNMLVEDSGATIVYDEEKPCVVTIWLYPREGMVIQVEGCEDKEIIEQRPV